MKRTIWLPIALGLILAGLGTHEASAQYIWNGAGGDDSWGTAANWTNNAVPATPYNGRIIFTNLDLGNVNILDGTRMITGTAQNTAYGLYYNVGSPAGSHLTDLNGNTLIINGGTLSVGYNASNSVAIITNGTVQIGTATVRADMNIGVNDFNTNLFGQSYLAIAGTLNVTNLGNLSVGRHLAGNANGNRGGILDLTGATINSTNGANVLKVNQTLGVAANNGGPSDYVVGRLYLPTSLQSLDVGSFSLGYERSTLGVLDFGVGSSLTNFICRGNYYQSYGSIHGIISNLPAGVTFTVGTTTPVDMYLGHNYPSGGAWITGIVVIANGRFFGNIANWYIGHQAGGNQPSITGRLDISSCQVRVGAAPDMIDVTRLAVGSRDLYSEGAASANGILRIPPAVTNLRVGILQLGYGLYGNGTIDIGTNSQLRAITITNGLYWGGNRTRFGYETGSGFVNYFPTGIEFNVGSPARYAPVELGVLYPHYGRGGTTLGNITITNGTFRGYFASLRMGLNVSSGTAQYPVGILDLRQATLGALVVTGPVFVASYPGYINSNATAYIGLPEASASFSNAVYVGDSNKSTRGIIELKQATLNLAGKFQVFFGGAVTARVGTTSCGLEILSSDTNNFVIWPTGRVCIVFEADPTNLSVNLSGLRMPGNQVAFFQSLTNGNRLTWDTSALTPGFSAGIYYDAVAGKTYVGIPGNAVAPVIENRMATNVTFTSAYLNGYLVSTGSHPVTVSVYWGDTDGGDPTLGNWKNTNTFGLQEWGELSYPTTNVTYSATNVPYYYRYVASSLAGVGFPATSTNLYAGEIWITAPDTNASEIGLDPGTFTVWRATSGTNAAVTVNYTIGGTAINNTDYTLSPAAGSVTIPAGAYSAAVTVNVVSNPVAEPPETVILTLAPGAYVIGSPASDTVTIADGGASTATNNTDVGYWVGEGLSDSWGEAANWSSNASPSLSYTGQIVFLTNDLGNVNLVEFDRTINGTAGSTSQGLQYNINYTNVFRKHTTDLNGKTLALNGGSLQVGYNAPFSVVTITNGILQLGATNRTDIYVAANLAVASPDITQTGTYLSVMATVDTRNVGTVWIGRSDRGNGPGAQGVLDLSAATLKSGTDMNRLVLGGDLNLGYNSGAADSRGEMYLPASLTSMEVGSLLLTYERNSRAKLDFGAGSALTSLTVRGSFSLSYFSGLGTVTNLPTNVTMSVGRPVTNVAIRVGTCYYSDSDPYAWHIGSFTLPNGRFIGALGEISVGQGAFGNEMPADGLLDLSSSSVQIGPAPDMVTLTNLNVGFKVTYEAAAVGGTYAKGVLKLPPTVTNITVGNLFLGPQDNCRGWIDIGSNSQLRALIVTNSFFFGGGEAMIGYDKAGTFTNYLPAGIQVRIGQPERYAHAQIARRHPSQYPSYGAFYGIDARLTVSNGAFAGYFSRLLIAMKEKGNTKVGTGVLDLRNATMNAFQVGGDFYLAKDTGEAPYGGIAGENANQYGYGYVYLPGGQVNISSNLYVGETNIISRGWLELFGTAVTVSNKVNIGMSGVVTTHVYSANCGLDLASSSTNDFVISTNGRVHLAFEEISPTIRGLRMTGDQQTFFQHLRDTGRLTWSTPDGKDAQIVYNGAATVVRYPPIPGALFTVW